MDAVSQNSKETPTDVKNSKKRTALLVLSIAVLYVILPMVILFSAFQNPAWVNSPISKRFESFVTGMLMANINVVTIPTNQVLHPLVELDQNKKRQIENGNYAIISATDVNSPRYKRPDKDNDENTFVIATIGPVDLDGKDLRARRKTIETVYKAAFRGEIDAVVEATEADHLLVSDWGRRDVAKLRESGGIRCVVFDGGHHIGSLSLKPDILLIPTMFYNGDFCATHAFTRDSVPIEKLKQTIEREYVGSIVVQLPRMCIPVKNSSAMGKLAFQAIADITDMTNRKAETDVGAKTRGSISESDTADDSKIQTTEDAATQKIKYKYIPIRKSIVFVSCDVPSSPSKDDILHAIKTAVDRQVTPGQHVRRVYAGLTFGTSQFPQRKPIPKINDKELEQYLSQKLPYYTEIMSKPVSTWDIIRTRLRF